ncbi:uncharacterized protein SCODWIG_03790 [Saccharomycodes ludwigii]|uniref:PA14 domain-containing protein n=1 Tax=Saccharomycodes ludwigii TaxID=36035 RepID=A0A376BBF6_9ASCO|nr:uncharacterized protein SCODWIG_03790 [Saccharomycodes ludwigii]
MGKRKLMNFEGCLPSTDAILQKTVGFNVKFYYYYLSYNYDIEPQCVSIDGAENIPSNYNDGGYAAAGLLGETNGATSLNYNFTPPINNLCLAQEASLPAGFNYDQQITLTNWTFVATAYFLPTISGNYNFTLGYVDDYAIFSIGGGTAYDCCMQDSTPATSQSYQIYSQWNFTGPTGINNIQVDLVAGIFYPIRILHYNIGNKGAITVGYTDPNGEYHDDWTNAIYTLPDSDEVCNATTITTTVPWKGSYTTTITTVETIYTGSTTTTDILLIVETPEVDAVTTTYTPWTGAFVTTIGTSVTTVIGSDGLPTTSTIYTVETPECYYCNWI